jgi:hypothetical protein
LGHYNTLEDKTKGALDGCADPNIHEIQISNYAFRAEKAYTLIHELLHARDMNNGYDSPENITVRRTDRTYRQIYGHSFLKK